MTAVGNVVVSIGNGAAGGEGDCVGYGRLRRGGEVVHEAATPFPFILGLAN